MSDETLQEFLDRHGVRFFTAAEIAPTGRAVYSAGRRIILQAPPPELWPHILPTLKAMDWLREKIGAPIVVNSGYRDPEYNTAVGGSPGSMHMRFNACDVACATRTPNEIAALLQTYPHYETLSVGRYASFVHLDTRAEVFGLPRWRQ